MDRCPARAEKPDAMRTHAPSSSARFRYALGPLVVLLAWVIGGLLLFGTPLRARAQAKTQIDLPGIQRLPVSERVEASVRLLQNDRTREAISLLRSMLSMDPALVGPEHGSAAYWLGRAYAQAGRPARARSTWQKGMRDLRATGRFDVRLADAYLRTLTPKRLRGERLYAVEVYRALFRRRVAQIAPLMSDSALGRVIREDRSTAPGAWTFRPGAGSALVQWWRGHDPLPATAVNERLEEHLTRLVHVQQKYGCPGRVSALDDRGIVYLRFGSPYKRRALNYEDGEFFREVYRFGVHIPPSSFPESEIWLYTHIDESGYYLFAESDTSDCFVNATANDLMPDYLTRPRSNTKRGLNIAYSALMAMRAIYRELALYHINFASRYSTIANYAGWQKMKAMNAKVARRLGGGRVGSAGDRAVKVGSGVGQTRYVFSNPTLGYSFPTRFVSRMVLRARQADEAAAERRRKAMPRQHTTLLEDSPRLPVAVRTARFLEPDGTTRTEIYWGIPAAKLPLSENDSLASSLLTVSAVQYGKNRQSSRRRRRRYRVNMQETNDSRLIVPPPITFRGATDLYHLGLQWGQYQLWPADSATGRKRMGPRRRMATARADSMRPLRAEGPRIEMSDVKVMTVPDTASLSLANPTAQARPYPFRTISPDTRVLLSFEVYHLSYNADDQTRYTVAYEVRGKTRRG
ncbi:MAG: tetratricopeptide repeat protein, partial [Salinibacter sp.]